MPPIHRGLGHAGELALFVDEAERGGINGHRILGGKETGVGDAVHGTGVRSARILERHPIHDREDDFLADPLISVALGERGISIAVALGKSPPVIEDPDRHPRQSPVHTREVAIAEGRNIDHLVDLAGK